MSEYQLPPLPEPIEIDWPELHSQALGCGVEDRGLRDRYECAEYGWQDGVDRAVERVPEAIFDAEQMQDYARTAIAPLLEEIRAREADSYIKAENLAMVKEREAKLREALAELVACARLRERIEMHDVLSYVETDDEFEEMDRVRAEYAERKPKAWDAASAALGESK